MQVLHDTSDKEKKPMKIVPEGDTEKMEELNTEEAIETMEAIDPEEVYESTTVEVTRLKSIVDQYNISHIKILKIDTEGSDGRILLDYFNCCKNEGYPFPFLIKYEHILLPRNERIKLCLFEISLIEC